MLEGCIYFFFLDSAFLNLLHIKLWIVVLSGSLYLRESRARLNKWLNLWASLIYTKGKILLILNKNILNCYNMIMNMFRILQ